MIVDTVQPESARELIALFISQLRNPHTATAYQHDLKQLGAFITASGISIGAMTLGQANRYVTMLKAKGLSPRSVRRHVSAARSFFRYLQSLQEVIHNPFTGVQLPPIGQEEHKVLTPDELDACFRVLIDDVKSILEACIKSPWSRGLRRRTFYAIRRRAVVALLANTGIRLSDLLSLQLSSIVQTASGFQLRVDDPGKSLLPVSHDSLPELIDWLKIRGNIPTLNRHLFVGYEGAPCSRMSIRQIMKWLQARVETNHTLQPQLFRPSFLMRQADAIPGSTTNTPA